MSMLIEEKNSQPLLNCCEFLFLYILPIFKPGFPQSKALQLSRPDYQRSQFFSMRIGMSEPKTKTET